MDGSGRRVGRTLRGAALGTSYGAVSRALGLPLNERLRAYNIFEFDVDRAVVGEVGDLCREHILPAIGRPEGPFRAGPHSFFCKLPRGWGSDVTFWSANDLTTYSYFEDVFRRLKLDASQFRGGAPGGELRVYSASLITRSQCTRTYFHNDFFPTCSAAVFTLITPLDDSPPFEPGQLLYRDVHGHDRVYEYRPGRAVAFGALVSHGTQVYRHDRPRSFLSFTFASDQPVGWRAIKRSVEIWRTLDYCGCWQERHIKGRRMPSRHRPGDGVTSTPR